MPFSDGRTGELATLLFDDENTLTNGELQRGVIADIL